MNGLLNATKSDDEWSKNGDSLVKIDRIGSGPTMVAYTRDPTDKQNKSFSY
jgi:hypothetical protein